MTDWHILLIVSHFRLEKRTKNSTTKKRRKVVIKVSLAFLSLILIRGIFRLYYGDLMVFWPWKIVSRKIFSSLCSSNKAAHLAILWYYARRNLPEKHIKICHFFRNKYYFPFQMLLLQQYEKFESVFSGAFCRA